MKPKYSTTINLTEAENKIWEELEDKGIKIIDIFRRGMEAYEKDLKNQK